MGPKKSGKSAKTKAKASATNVEEHVVTKEMVLSNFTKFCRAFGIPPNPHLVDVFRAKEDEGEINKIILEGEIGALGAASIRAFTTAILATLLEAANSTGPQLAYLELLDCNIGTEGCEYIGQALKNHKPHGGLFTLSLKYNTKISDQGCEALCTGLFTNRCIKQLHLDYCNIGAQGAIKLAQLISIPSSCMDTLSLNGNSLGNEGLYHLSLGLARAPVLVNLFLSDNGIRNGSDALNAFRDALLRAKSLLSVDFTYNHIDEDGAAILLLALTSEQCKLTNFQVDASLPATIFAQLNKTPKAEGKKKGKKGAKKK